MADGGGPPPSRDGSADGATIAVVTGASRGIGEATARRLVAAGHRVVACGRSEPALEQLAAECTGIIAVPADVSRERDVERVAAAAEAAGRLAVWVNNAAILEPTPFSELTHSAWRATMAVDLDGVFLGCRAAFARMRGHGGVIVNVASLSGVAQVEKFPGLAAYNVAKAGVIALSEAVALEGREHGVACVCVSPGAVDTEMLRRAAPELRAGMTADQMAEIIAWLAGPAGVALSGSNIPLFSNR